MTHIPAGWRPIESAPKDGTEFQAWLNIGEWEPRCRFNPDTEAFEIWGRVDYDRDDWDACGHLTATHWMPIPAAPSAEQDAGAQRQVVAWADPDTLDVISTERKASWLSEYGAGGAAKAESYTRALSDISQPSSALLCAARAVVAADDDQALTSQLINELRAACEDAGAPAAGDALDEPVPEWAACESRRPWVTNSLKANAQELREKEKRCRTAFNKDFMGMPSRYVADAYAEAAAVFEAKLAAIAAQRQGDA